MPYARRGSLGGRFRDAGDVGQTVRVRQVAAPAPPPSWDVVTVTTRALLDRVHDRLQASPHDTGEAMYHLQSGLREVKSRCSADEWERVAAECQAHPVAKLLWQDPFTRHSYDRPSGYAGDARLLDYLYGVSGAPPGTTPLGESVFGHMMAQQGALGVRARRDVLAQLIDEAADQFDRPRILSIACGHLREGTDSAALMQGRVGELVALDQDADSLAEVERVYAGAPVRAVHCSVRAVLAGKVNFEGFHFVYAAGLYDYLSERVAARLTRQMFDMVVPGGRVLVANFAPGLPEVGYMETFMGWKLIYRTPEEMARLSAEVPGGQWKSHRVFWDASENIVFLDLVKRGARSGVTVPGMEHVTFGPGVRAATEKPAAATQPDPN
jgi:extracellular factor (EF) 3-hydroxypalmitic acid methyl ester biosynthesis protein